MAIVLEHRLHQIARDVGPQDSDQRILRPERIPQTQHACEIAEVAPVHFRVGAPILSRHVGIEHRVEHSVIKAGIENFPAGRFPALDPNG